MSGRALPETDLTEPNYYRVALYFAFGNAALTAMVLLSPFGIGDGRGMIGYSISRMLVMVFVQTPIALGGIIVSIASFRHGFKWVTGLVSNIGILTCAFFLYFAQSKIIERFL